jgi:SAM-dependent methyltransferase
MSEFASSKHAGEFDVLHSSDTIEHLPDPVGVLRYYLPTCKPGGLVVNSTPNYDSIVARMLQLKPTEHVILFNAKSLAFMLGILGLEDLDIFCYDRYRNLSAMFESTTFDGLPGVKPVFRLVHRLFPELRIRFPGQENIVAIARKPNDAAGATPL